MTPLIFAASNGRLDAVKLLVARGANVNAEDSFYHSTAAGMALGNGHVDIAVFLLQNGWEGGADDLALFGVQSDNATLVKTALTSKVTRQGVQAALGAAERMKRAALIPILKAALDALPAEPAAPAFAVDPATLGRYAGTYRAGADGMTMTVSAQEGSLTAQVPGQPAFRLTPSAAGVFRVPEVNATLTFNERGGLVESIQLVQGPATIVLARVASTSAPASPTAIGGQAHRIRLRACRHRLQPTAPAAPRNWPSFRGAAGSGNGDGQRAPSEWDVASGRNIKWKTAIPGIANSSPIVWGNRVFVTTAISKAGDKSFRTGLYGDVKPVEIFPSTSGRSMRSISRPGKSYGNEPHLSERRKPNGTPRRRRRTPRRRRTAGASWPHSDPSDY